MPIPDAASLHPGYVLRQRLGLMETACAFDVGRELQHSANDACSECPTRSSEEAHTEPNANKVQGDGGRHFCSPVGTLSSITRLRDYGDYGDTLHCRRNCHVLASSRRRSLRRASLRGKRPEILLARLQRVHFGGGGSLQVHGEPQRPDEKASDASGDVLGHLGARFIGELLDARVVGDDFSLDCRTIGHLIVRLNHSDRLRSATGAGT